MRYRNTSLLIFMLVIAGCKPSESTAVTPATPVDPAANAAAPPAADKQITPDVTSGFTEGMPYAELRKQLLDAGWLPLQDPMCRENAGGAVTVCFELPEVESCSGDGHCVMHFANADDGKLLQVTSYGPYERWNVAGQESAFAVKSWQASAVVPQETATTCPAQDFDEFLKAFASDAKIEKAFTAPLVKVAILYSNDEGDHERTVYVTAAAYDDFILSYRNGGWYTKPVEDQRVRDVSVNVNTAAETDGSFYVTLPGSVEGISYRFAKRGNCWQLIADPDVVS